MKNAPKKIKEKVSLQPYEFLIKQINLLFLQLFPNPPLAIVACPAEITFPRRDFFTSFHPCVSMRVDLFSTFTHLLHVFWDYRDYIIGFTVDWILGCIGILENLWVYHVWHDLHTVLLAFFVTLNRLLMSDQQQKAGNGLGGAMGQSCVSWGCNFTTGQGAGHSWALHVLWLLGICSVISEAFWFGDSTLSGWWSSLYKKEARRFDDHDDDDDEEGREVTLLSCGHFYVQRCGWQPTHLKSESWSDEFCTSQAISTIAYYQHATWLEAVILHCNTPNSSNIDGRKQGRHHMYVKV